MKPATGDSGIAGLGKGRRTDRSVLLMLGRDDLLPSVYLIKPAVPSDIDMNTWRNQEYFRIRTRNPTTSGTIGLPSVICLVSQSVPQTSVRSPQRRFHSSRLLLPTLGGGHGAFINILSESERNRAKSSTSARTVAAGSAPIGIESHNELQ